MSKKLQLSIPKPCHENWDGMTPVEQGKFCGSCQKQVVDFSDMSDRQVAEFFKKPSTGSVCGRFMTDQLEREIEIPKKRIPWFKYFFQFALPAFLISIKASAQKTQGKIKVTTVTKDTTSPQMRPLMGKVASNCVKPPRPEIMGDVTAERHPAELNTTVQLKVVDTKGAPIHYASIETGVIGKGGTTDQNGLFKLDKSILNANGNIFVSAGGYERKAVAIKTLFNVNGIVTVILQEKGWLNVVVATAITPGKARMTLGSVTMVRAEDLYSTIKGKVVDENNNPVPFATVMIKGTTTGTAANEKGLFTIRSSADAVTLVGSGITYRSTEVLVNKNSFSDTVIIKLSADNRMMVGELVICRNPSKKELKNIPLIPVTPTDPAAPVFRVYPNPVEAGANLNIEWKQAEEGYYTLELLNGSGQSVHRQEIWIDAEAKLLSIDLPEVAAGNYFLSLVNKKSRKTFTEKLIIQ